MSKLIWIEVGQSGDASRLAEMLESNGIRADTSRTLRGKPEVRIEKPLFRRMKPFMVDLELVVRRWLTEEAPETQGVIAKTAEGRLEIRSPVAQQPLPGAKNTAAA
jgi:hypothetical protein